MTVTVSKPALNIREELSALKKPSGIKGEELLRANTTDDVYNVIGRNRNLIINGGFNVWQRGTSGTVVGGPAYCSADRWKCFVNTSTTITLSRQTFTPGQKEVPGNPTYYARFDWLGTGASQFFGFEQLIEGCHWGAGDFITVSFYARSELGDNMNLGISQKCDGSADVACGDTTFNLETTWKRYVYTYPMPSLVGKTIGANNALSITFWRTGTLNSYLDIANVQVEVGTTATPFEYRSIGTELQLCKRYCEVWQFQSGATTDRYHSGVGWTDQAVFKMEVEKRTYPSVTIAGAAELRDGANGQKTITSTQSNRFAIQLGVAPATLTNSVATIRFGSGAGDAVIISAEL